MRPCLSVQEASLNDFERILPFFTAVIKRGDTLYCRSDLSEEEARDFWFSEDKKTYIALLENQIVGAYFIRPHQLDRGSHVANAGYVVDPVRQNLGIGATMAKHSIEEAKRMGYLAMQFVFVVSTNVSGVTLWKKMGFQIVGTSPKSFNHASLGYVDTYIMHRFLD